MKDFLHDHFNKLIIVEKIIYKITGIKALKGTLMQIEKSTNIFVFTLKYYAEGFSS